MKKLILLIGLLIFGNIKCFSQNSFNLNVATAYDDYFTDFVKIQNKYFISGFQVNQNTSGTSTSLRNFIVKVDNNGNLVSFNILDSFNTVNFSYVSLFYNNNIYSFGIKGIGLDSSCFSIWKRDTSLALLSNRTYNDIKFKGTFSINSNYHLQDSSISLFCNYFDSLGKYNPFLININLNNLNVIDTIFFNEHFYFYDYVKDTISCKYNIISTMYGNNSVSSNVIVRYDYNYSFIDTLNLQYYPKGNSNIMVYKKSKYIFSANGPDIWNVDPNNPNFYDKLRLTVVDSNFNFLFQKSFGDIDSTEVKTGFGTNLVQNFNNDFFAASYVIEGLFTNNPNLGLLVVKLDSNLNEIWHKNIKGNSKYRLLKIGWTDDGGVLLLVDKGAKNSTSAEALFIKIGPNGEVTNITDLNINRKKSMVSIYPNPATETLNVSLINKEQNIEELSIYDMQFKEIERLSIRSLEARIDISTYTKGIYLLEGKTNKGEVFVKKFIVK